MDPEDLRRLRQFLQSFAEVLYQVQLPVPPRPQGDWPGQYLEAKEMYDSYNRLPSHLQEIVAEGLFLGEEALSVVAHAAGLALVAQYKLVGDTCAKTGVPVEMLLPGTAQERVRAGRRLMLVRDPEDEKKGEEDDEVAQVRAEIEDIVWNRVLARRRADGAVDAAVHNGPDEDGGDDEADGASGDVSDAVAPPGPVVSVAIEHDHEPRRTPRWRAAAALAAAALVLVGTTWMVATSIDKPDSDAARKSAALNQQLPHPLPVEMRDMGDSSQSFDIGDVSVTVRQLLDGENKGQLEFTVLNKGDEERTLNIGVGAGGQPAVDGLTNPTTLQPGEAFRRVVPTWRPRTEKDKGVHTIEQNEKKLD